MNCPLSRYRIPRFLSDRLVIFGLCQTGLPQSDITFGQDQGKFFRTKLFFRLFYRFFQYLPSNQIAEAS